jgi:hypothetical protein
MEMFSHPKRKSRGILGVLLACTTVAGLVLWFSGFDFFGHDPLFHGKPESAWIKDLRSNDDAQIREWRAFGEEGVQVLIRGLRLANNRPIERAYRKWNRILPAALRQVLPSPKPDSTQVTRERLVYLLASLGSDAKSAVPVMIRTANEDESPSVRQGAISFFITAAGDNTLGNQISSKEKKALLPSLLRALQDPGNWGQRSNAAILLKFYAEQRDVVGPALVTALQDAHSQVRLCVAEALNRVAPELANQTGATAMLVAFAKHPEAQIASMAVTALGHPGSQPELAVPVLIDCLGSSNTAMGCEAVWALEWAPKEFHVHSKTVIPALRNATERKDSVGRYAKVALEKWESYNDPIGEVP